MNPPPTYPNGSCKACLANLPRCDYHEAQEQIREKAASETLRRVVEGIHENERWRMCCEFELESDEGGTRWEKAERIRLQRKATA